MLDEGERRSLLEIEDHLRESDAEFVRAFDILTRIAGQRPPNRRRPAPAPRHRPGLPPGPSAVHRPPAPPSLPPVLPPTSSAPHPVTPPAGPTRRDGGPLMRLVQGMLAAALVLPLISFGLAAVDHDVATLVLCAGFGALTGLVAYAAAAAARARRR
ncbi:MAG: hypothetical protein AB7J32_26195 [Pseudonocardia sp.]